MQSELDVVKYRKLLEKPDILEGSRDALLVDLDRAVSGELFSI